MDMDEPAVKAESFKKLKEEKLIPFICVVGKKSENTLECRKNK